MQVVRPLQKAWRIREATERTSVRRDQPGAMDIYWSILLSQRPMQEIVTATGEFVAPLL